VTFCTDSSLLEETTQEAEVVVGRRRRFLSCFFVNAQLATLRGLESAVVTFSRSADSHRSYRNGREDHVHDLEFSCD
jgi:hypothetical protein